MRITFTNSFRIATDAMTAEQPIQTPSTHRQRLGAADPRMGLASSHSTGFLSNIVPYPRISPSGRQALSTLNANVATGPGFTGYGLTAGLKVSNPAGSPANGVERPMIRSRGLTRARVLFTQTYLW